MDQEARKKEGIGNVGYQYEERNVKLELGQKGCAEEDELERRRYRADQRRGDG